MDFILLLVSQYKLLLTIALLLGLPALIRLQEQGLENMVRGRIDPHRKYRARLLLKALSVCVLVCVLLILWGIELRGLLLVGSSLFAMLGVALFAGWSLLSNLTSFLLLFIQNDCRVDHWVRIVDGANCIEGKIIEMGLFNVILENNDGNKVLYPNNLFIVRPVIIFKSAPEIAEVNSIQTANTEQ